MAGRPPCPLHSWLSTGPPFRFENVQIIKALLFLADVQIQTGVAAVRPEGESPPYLQHLCLLATGDIKLYILLTPSAEKKKTKLKHNFMQKPDKIYLN